MTLDEFKRLIDEQVGLVEIKLQGMGEPLMNWKAVDVALTILNAPDGIGIGARHITLSTVGWLPGIEALEAKHFFSATHRAIFTRAGMPWVELTKALPRGEDASIFFQLLQYRAPLDRNGLVERAARRGHLEAQNTLGFFLQHGVGTTPDPAKARDRVRVGFSVAASVSRGGRNRGGHWIHHRDTKPT